MPTTKFYKYPFGQSGDKTAISNQQAPLVPNNSGVVTYEYGFTPNYELDLANDPNALPVPRDQSNQLYYDITLNIQQYQTQGTPNFITSADNGGSAYAYPIYARCLYNGQLYENQVAGNTQTPGVDATWILISGGAQFVPVGTIIDFAGVNPPGGYLKCDGTDVLRATYPLLFAALTQTESIALTLGQNTFTVASSANYYIGMAIEGVGIDPNTVITNIAGTTITINNPATVTSTELLTFFNWGNGDGSSTFTLPNFIRRVGMGSGGTGTLTIGNVTGQTGGAEAVQLGINEMPSHNHPGSVTNATWGTYAANGTGGNVTYNSPPPPVTPMTMPCTIATEGNGAAHNNVQPSAIVTKCIKF